VSGNGRGEPQKGNSDLPIISIAVAPQEEMVGAKEFEPSTMNSVQDFRRGKSATD
jgi:hypothetical protein